jgi:hypothetical protein
MTFRKYLALEGDVPLEKQTLSYVFEEDNKKELSGTYIHPRLLAHFAMWASPQFEDKVCQILNANIMCFL